MTTTQKVVSSSLIAAVLAGLTALVTTRISADEPGGAHLVLPADEVEWREGPPSLPPGAQMAIVEGDPTKAGLSLWRLRLPAGYRVAPHTHPVAERVTVLSGALRVGAGERFDPARTTLLTPGGHFRMPPRHAHYVVADEETVLQLTTEGPWGIIYVNPDDDPRRSPR